MSTDDQQRRGGFVPIGELAGTLPGSVPRGRAMTAQTRHHFTMLRQVNQLIEASEAEPDIGFMARLLALCSLPRTDPKNRLQYVRRRASTHDLDYIFERGWGVPDAVGRAATQQAG